MNNQQKIRIVIADDHKMFREGLKVLFEQEDSITIVAEAEDGQQSIELVDQYHPDVLILDIEMRGMNGLDAAKILVQDHPETKILILSRHTERRYVSEMFLLGVSGYILKDSAVDELVSAIKTVISGQTFCSPGLVGVMVSSFSRKIGQSSEKLSDREIEVLKLIADGLQTKEIARKLCVSIKTIDSHRQRIMKKLDLHSAVELTKYAIKEGIITL